MKKYEVQLVYNEAYPKRNSDFRDHPIYELIEEDGLVPKKIVEYDNLEDAKKKLAELPAAKAVVMEHPYDRSKVAVRIDCYRIEATDEQENGVIDVELYYSEKEDEWWGIKD